MPEHERRCGVPGCADERIIRGLAQRDRSGRGGFGLGEPNFPAAQRNLWPFEGDCLLHPHSRFSQKPNGTSHHGGSALDQTLDLGIRWVTGARSRLSNVALRELLDWMYLDHVEGDREGAEDAQGAQVAPDRSSCDAGLAPGGHEIGQATFVDLIEIQAPEKWRELPQACPVTVLARGLQTWQVLAAEPFQCLLIGPAWASAPIQPAMLFEDLSEILLGDGFRGRPRRPAHLFTPDREANPPNPASPVNPRHSSLQ